MEITLNQPEACSLYKFYRYQKYDIRYEMYDFYHKHNVYMQDIFENIWGQYLDQFAEYRIKGLRREMYTYNFNEDECKRLLIFTNTINDLSIYKTLKRKYTDIYVEDLHKALNVLNKELKEMMS